MQAGILRETPVFYSCAAWGCVGGNPKDVGNVFTFQEPAWTWGSWHFWASSDKGLLLHRGANNLKEC